MDEFTPEEIAAKKKAIFDSMGKRGQRQIMKIGYDKWDPIQTPKDPIDIRSDRTKRTTQQLIRKFLQETSHETYSTVFGQGAFDMAELGFEVRLEIPDPVSRARTCPDCR